MATNSEIVTRGQKVLIGNLPVFHAAGLTQVEISASDIEDFQSYEAPMFSTAITFSCLAPVSVAGDADAIADVTIAVSTDV